MSWYREYEKNGDLAMHHERAITHDLGFWT